MHTVCDRNYLRFAAVRKLQCLHRTHRIPREADADHHIILRDADHLLENLAGTVCLYLAHIRENHMEIERQKARKRRAAPNADNVNGPRRKNRIRSALKGAPVHFFQRHLDFFNIRLQDGLQNFSLRHAAIRKLHPLHRIQTVHHHLLQCALELRISRVAKLHRKANRCRFADADLLSQARCRHRYGLVIMCRNKICQPLLSFAQLSVILIQTNEEILVRCLLLF